MTSVQPTLSQIKAWPAAVDLVTAASAFGISRSHAYALAKRGEFPATVLTVGGRLKVTTASIIAALEK
jgi:hypothetical protein